MKAAIFCYKLDSLDRFGGLACALALLPMLLWPSLVRAECCCTDSAALSQVAPTNSTPAVPAANLTSGTSLPTLDLDAEASAGCPHCITSPPESAALTSHCDCQTHQLASFISPRADSSSTYFRTDSFLRVFTAVPNAVDMPAPARGVDISVRLLAPTANQRRAFLCCWLN